MCLEEIRNKSQRIIRSCIIHLYAEVHLIHCLSSLQIIEMYDGLIDGHLINKTNILAVMIVMYSNDSNYATPNHYQHCPPNQVGHCPSIEVLTPTV